MGGSYYQSQARTVHLVRSDLHFFGAVFFSAFTLRQINLPNMKRAIMLLAVVPHIVCGQTSNPTIIKPSPSYRLTMDFAPGTHLQQNFQSGIDLQLSYTTSRWTFTAQSFVTPFEKFDTHRAELNQRFSYAINEDAKAPAYNQSSLMAVRNLLTKTRDTTTVFRSTAIGVRGGYYFTQRSRYGTMDYYRYGGDSDNGILCVAGERIHAAALGMDFVFERVGKNSTIRQHLYADMLVGFNVNLVGYRYYAPEWDTSKGHFYSADVNASFRKEHFGTRFGYEIRWYGKRGIGLYASLEGHYKPNVVYHSSSEYYVPRGGETIWASTAVAKIGLTHRFMKK